MLVMYAELETSGADAAWIDRIRRAHDPQRDRVPAHVTFVFPLGEVGEGVALDAARAAAAETDVIGFRLCDVRVSAGGVDDLSRIFLLPGVGADAMRALHARLHAGPLAAGLRADMPFAPHVTIGAFARRADAERVAAGLGAVDIDGRLEALTVARLGPSELTPIAVLAFGRPPRAPGPH